MAKTVVVDSDAIFAIYNPNDSLNKQATKTFGDLIAKNYQFIYPTSVIFEIISLFQRVLPTPTVTEKLIEMIKDDRILTYVVDNYILKESVKLFKPAGSRKNTLIDCSVVVITKKIKADGVFGFDSFYRKNGIKLATDLVV